MPLTWSNGEEDNIDQCAKDTHEGHPRVQELDGGGKKSISKLGSRGLSQETHPKQEENGQEHGGEEHASHAVEMQRPPPRSVHQHDGHECHDNHHHAHADCRIFGPLFTQAGRRENVGGIVEDGIDARQLLRQLHDNADHERLLQNGIAKQLESGDLECKETKKI